MEIQIIEHIKERVQVVIKCRQMDNEIIRLKITLKCLTKNYRQKKTMNGVLSVYLMYCILSP